ncbi:MAG: TolC family protein [Odoribacter splanchnicus]|nr:TolC family protein [Odoribacter splanchnicus]
MMRWALLIGLQLSIVQVLPAQKRITLEQCIERALEANYSIKMIRNQEKIAANDLNYSPFLPTLGVTAGQKQTINDSKTTTNGENRELNNSRSDALTAGVALNWRLFDGLGMFVTQEKYQEMLTIGELNTQMAIENLIVNVSASYYNVIMQHSKLDAARHSLGLSTERYKEARDKYMLGVLSGLDAQQAKLDLNADSSNYMKQKELLKSAYIALNLSMNADLQQAMYVRDSITLLEPLVFSELNDKMLELNTTLMIGRRDRKVSELDMKLARAALFPTLDFAAGYNYSRTKAPEAATSLNRTNGPYWGFSVSMDVFNRLDNRKRIKNARLDMENADLSYQDAELQLKADLAQLYNTYENNLQIVSFEKESAAVAFENLDAALEKYKLGTLSGIEFREFQRSYIDAVDREVTAAYQAKVSELSLLLISGELKVKN